jgi:hypothetical protein
MTRMTEEAPGHRASVTSLGTKIPGGQRERLRRADQVAEEHGDAWAEPRARIAG